MIEMVDTGRIKVLKERLGIDVEMCEIEGGEVECLTQITDKLDEKLKEMRGIIEKQKKHYAFNKYSYPALDEALKEVGY